MILKHDHYLNGPETIKFEAGDPMYQVDNRVRIYLKGIMYRFLSQSSKRK